MDIELKEIRDFTANHGPFSDLPAEELDGLVRQISIRYLRRGAEFPPPSADEGFLYLLRSGAIDIRDADGNLLAKLAEGDVYGELCRNDQDFSQRVGHAVEDCLLYSLPCATVHDLCRRFDSFKRYFSVSVGERIKSAAASIQGPFSSVSAWQLEASDLTYRVPVMIESSATIQLAAQLMAKESVSSVLVTENNALVGIMTDRDLRNRCLSTDISRQQPVKDIMTPNPVTIGSHTLLSEALLTMTRLQVQHLPVVQDNKPVANLSVSDIIRHLSANSAFIAIDIDKAQDVDALVKISQRLPELQVQLAGANASALRIGEAMSSVTDALTRRLLQLAEQQYGAPPVPYVWVAGGSQGRNEQTTYSDQDNALVIDDDMREEHGDYFARLAGFVTDGLNACGYYYCPGEAMASNPLWRQPVRQWLQYFQRWIDSPERKALMLSSIFFDLRPVFGAEDLFTELQNKVLARTKVNGIFIAYMVSNALTHRPPLGFFRNFVLVRDGEHNNALDIKHRGLVPIIDIARVYALANGIPAVNSTERLKAAHGSGALSREMSDNLIDAYELIAGLRIQHQTQQIRQGLKADNYLPPAELSGLDRSHLKDAFDIIKTMQEVLESRHQTSRFR